MSDLTRDRILEADSPYVLLNSFLVRYVRDHGDESIDSLPKWHQWLKAVVWLMNDWWNDGFRCYFGNHTEDDGKPMWDPQIAAQTLGEMKAWEAEAIIYEAHAEWMAFVAKCLAGSEETRDALEPSIVEAMEKFDERFRKMHERTIETIDDYIRDHVDQFVVEQMSGSLPTKERIPLPQHGENLTEDPVDSGEVSSTTCQTHPSNPEKQNMAAPSNTVQLHRVLRAPAERVYRAFLDPDALCRWLPPFGYLGKIDRIDPQVGGSFHMTFTHFQSGHSHSFESKFLELVPGERLRLADKFDDPGLEADMTKTITLRPVSCGTEMKILHEGLPAAIPAEMCYLGWQESLVQLANLVEHEMPEA